MPTDYLHITGITENSWQPPMSCIKAENRTGCQNGPSAWIKLWMLKKRNDGRAGKEQTWKKAVVPKTPEEILQKSTTEVLHSNYSLSMSTRIVLKHFHGNLKLSKNNKTVNLMVQLINTLVSKSRCSAPNKMSTKTETWEKQKFGYPQEFNTKLTILIINSKAICLFYEKLCILDSTVYFEHQPFQVITAS